MKLTRLVSLALSSGVALATIGAAAPNASAALLNSYQFNGKGNWSLDAVGGNGAPVGDIEAFVPLGSTIEKAFLYSTNTFGNTNIPTINFDGTTYSGASWTNLGISSGNFTAFRTDVTSQVAAKVGGGSLSNFLFSILSEDNTGSVDGEALAIVYSNPNESERTIAFLDGFLNPSGDTTSINFANPLTAAQIADPNFQASLSLGIGYSYQLGGGNQVSNVDINGTRLTSAAGGEDDGASTNGGLITIGGIGDSTANPVDPNAAPTNPRSDDELYTLTPFLADGNTQIQINTNNPSGDDHIFFAGVNITATAGVNAPPPNAEAVPEPFTIIGTLVGGSAALRMRKKLKSSTKA